MKGADAVMSHMDVRMLLVLCARCGACLEEMAASDEHETNEPQDDEKRGERERNNQHTRHHIPFRLHLSLFAFWLGGHTRPAHSPFLIARVGGAPSII